MSESSSLREKNKRKEVNGVAKRSRDASTQNGKLLMKLKTATERNETQRPVMLHDVEYLIPVDGTSLFYKVYSGERADQLPEINSNPSPDEIEEVFVVVHPKNTCKCHK